MGVPTFKSGQRLLAQALNEAISHGILFEQASSGASGVMSSTNIVTLPGTSYTITNSTSVSRKYLVIASVRVNMASGTNGLYRPLVLDGTPAALGGSGLEQFVATVTGAPGATGGDSRVVITLAPAASQLVQAGGLRVAGGGALDTFTSGRLVVIDQGTAI